MTTKAVSVEHFLYHACIVFVVTEEKTDSSILATPTKEQEEENNPTPAPSPSGVNRRTAVLFSKKGFRKSQPPTPPSSEKPARKGPGRPPKHRPDKDKDKENDKDKDGEKDKEKEKPDRATRLPEGPCLSARSPKSPASPRSPGGRKRSASMSLATEAEVPSAKRSLSLTEPLMEGSENLFSASTHRTSFMNYRSALPVSMSDIDTTSESSSTDESFSDSESHDESNSENGDTGTRKYSRRGKLGSATASLTTRCSHTQPSPFCPMVKVKGLAKKL